MVHLESPFDVQHQLGLQQLCNTRGRSVDVRTFLPAQLVLLPYKHAGKAYLLGYFLECPPEPELLMVMAPTADSTDKGTLPGALTQSSMLLLTGTACALTRHRLHRS